MNKVQIPMATRSKAWVSCRSLAGDCVFESLVCCEQRCEKLVPALTAANRVSEFQSECSECIVRRRRAVQFSQTVRHIVAERKNTITCSFDPQSPRITAYEIHEWIYEKLKIPGDGVAMIQIDGPKRQVFIKLKQNSEIIRIIQDSQGSLEYKHKRRIITCAD